MTKPAALLVTRNLPPLTGGMERVVWHMADALRKTFDLHVVGPAGCARHLPEGVRADEIPPQPAARFLVRAAARALGYSRRHRPQWVIAGSGLTAPIARVAASRTRARSLAYLHGLDIAPPCPLYTWLWQPAFRRLDNVLVNSRYTRNLAIEAGIFPARITCLHPGVTLPRPEERDKLRRSFRERFGFGDALLMLSVGRLTTRKGLLEFVRDVMPLIVQACPDVKLVVAGDVPRHALLAEAQTPSQIRETARNAGFEERLYFLGEITDREKLKTAYFSADVHVFPVRSLPRDPEGFGMVAVEAAAHDLPTVAYATGGVTDAVSEGESGRLVRPGDFHAFASAVVSYLRHPGEDSGSCRTFAKRFAWSGFADALNELLIREPS